MFGRMEGGLEHRRGYSSKNRAGEDEGGVGADRAPEEMLTLKWHLVLNAGFRLGVGLGMFTNFLPRLLYGLHDHKPQNKTIFCIT